MKIAEIFHSVQGEIDVGKPSIFVRFSGCNLIQAGKGCVWCDTKYAEDGQEMKVSSVVDEVLNLSWNAHMFSRCRNIVITGGESMLQKEAVFSVVEALWMKDQFTFDIETNGTIYDPRLRLFDRINCSPKKQAVDMWVLKGFASHSTTRFKFVFEPGEEKWWEDITNNLEIPRKRVWIMPQGATQKQQLELSPGVIEYCKLTGYNFSPRLHILVWDKKRGV
jgi:7-carboxy-7-deazaguanine synthase